MVRHARLSRFLDGLEPFEHLGGDRYRTSFFHQALPFPSFAALPQDFTPLGTRLLLQRHPFYAPSAPSELVSGDAEEEEEEEEEKLRALRCRYRCGTGTDYQQYHAQADQNEAGQGRRKGEIEPA